VRHHRLAAAAEEAQELVDQPAVGGGARDGCIEHVSVADLLDAPRQLVSPSRCRFLDVIDDDEIDRTCLRRKIESELLLQGREE
jgi:hypothetical protein